MSAAPPPPPASKVPRRAQRPAVESFEPPRPAEFDEEMEEFVVSSSSFRPVQSPPEILSQNALDAEAPSLDPASVRMLADQPLERDEDDLLGFSVYADALAAVIDNPGTGTPLTIAIHAPWGAGKSSLARMVERRLRGKPAAGGTQPHTTCWFNAWMHDDAERLSTALAAFVAREADRRRPLWKRWIRPLPPALRPPGERVLYEFAFNLVTLMVASVLAVFFASSLHDPPDPFALSKEVAPLGTFLQSQFGALGTTFFGFAFAALTAYRYLAAPVVSSVANMVRNRQAEAGTGSVDRVREQLNLLIDDALPKGSRLVVFVDDLERCRPPGAIDLLEGVNQLLCQPQVVTVICADIPAVAAQAEIKYAAMVKTQGNRSPAYGRLYLQKIIQLQFDLPEPSEEAMKGMLARLADPEPSSSNPDARGIAAAELGAPAPPRPFAGVREWASSRVQLLGYPLALLIGLALVGELAALLPSPYREWALSVHSFLLLALLMGAFLVRQWWRREQKAAQVLQGQRGAIDSVLRSGKSADQLASPPATSLSKTQWSALVKERKQLQIINDSSYFRQAVEVASQPGTLPGLPRHARRLLNRLRLLVFIAYQKGLGRSVPPIEPRHVGKWAVLQERWPEVASRVGEEPEFMASLEEAAFEEEGETWQSVLDTIPAVLDDTEDLRRFCREGALLGGVVRSLVRFEAAEEGRMASWDGKPEATGSAPHRP